MKGRARGIRPRLHRGGLAAALVLLGAGPLPAQEGDVLQVRTADGREVTLPLARHRGYPAVPGNALAPLGMGLEALGDGWTRLTFPGGEVRLREGNPFVRTGGASFQMVGVPHRVGSEFHIPAQLLTEILPAHGGSGVVFRDGVLEVAVATAAPRPAAPPPTPAGPTLARPAPPPAAAPDQTRAVSGAGTGKRVVVIDPGHGGSEPGAVGPTGVREKDIALAVGLALAAELRKDPTLEVHLTRDRDVAVDLWSRGEMATRWKGDRPGVFISLHANSVPDRRAVRGFETYFLAEARTDDARRVAAIENAPLNRPGSHGPSGGDPGLNSILNELRMLDHQHWSALLAEFVQQEVASHHPGPNRGVKQGPFAVLTNALMPSVLVEIGFISNREEERLMTRRDFQEESARAIARAVQRFFQRYPPGTASGGGGG